MNKLRKQSDATYPLFFLMVDSTDHVTGKTGLSPTVTISKNGGSFASPSGAVTEVGNGVYKIAGNATDSNTVGELWIHATGTGADPTDTSYTIVAYDPFDSVRLGLTSLPNAAAEAAGGLYTRGSGAGQINQTTNGRVDANAVSMSGTTLTARDIGSSVLLSSGTGTGQVSIASGVVASNMTQIDGAATNGNNAKLYLKHLSVINNTATEAAVELRGASAGAPSSRGGEGLKITGGGGGLTTSNGYGLNIQSGVGGNGYQEAVVLGNYNTVSAGLTIRGNGLPALVLYRHDASNPVVSAKNSFGNVRGTIEADITGNITGNVSGSVGIVSTLRPVKNVGYNNFMFPMFDSSTKSPKAGLSVTAERAIDGNPFSPCSNAVAEIGSGVYRINLSADDMNGDKIMFRFTSTGADDQLIEVFTQG